MEHLRGDGSSSGSGGAGTGGGGTGGSGTGAGGSTGSSPTPASDTISIDPDPAFAGHHTFVLTGTASSPSGVGSVEFTAEVDGVETDLGAAKLNANGTFTFKDDVGPHVQEFITGTVTDMAGGTASDSPSFIAREPLRRISRRRPRGSLFAGRQHPHEFDPVSP